jgi:lipoprotein-anchoring transpeptidase ErfK/SrfK
MRPRLAGAAIAGVAVALLITGCGQGGTPSAHTGPSGSAASAAAKAPASPQPVSGAKLASLTAATTYTHLHGAPADPDPSTVTSGLVVHPRTTQAVYASPGVPVIQSQPGWDRVLLPSRPDHASGWVATHGSALQEARTPYVIRVNTAARRVTVFDSGRKVGEWPAAVGAPGTPTPTGRTFVMASLQPTHPTYTPLLFPLGTHSDTLDTFGGGPGTVALHGWPDPSVFGHAVSHGCVRVPSAALHVLAHVPLGSLVLVSS